MNIAHFTPVQGRFFDFIRNREEARLSYEMLGDNCSPDPIIAKSKFCNVNREHDRVTVWVRENVREPLENESRAVMLLNIAACRIFNHPPTLEHLVPCKTAAQCVSRVRKLAETTKSKIFRGAYMMPAHNGAPKDRIGIPLIEYWATVLEEIERRHKILCSRKSFADLAYELATIRGLGEFLANQFITDLRYTPQFQDMPDLYNFVLAGPGTRRGINRFQGRDKDDFGKLRSTDYTAFLLALRDGIRLQRILPHRIFKHFEDPNNLSNCFCEFDKYERGYEALSLGKPIKLKCFKPHTHE